MARSVSSAVGVPRADAIEVFEQCLDGFRRFLGAGAGREHERHAAVRRLFDGRTRAVRERTLFAHVEEQAPGDAAPEYLVCGHERGVVRASPFGAAHPDEHETLRARGPIDDEELETLARERIRKARTLGSRAFPASEPALRSLGHGARINVSGDDECRVLGHDVRLRPALAVVELDGGKLVRERVVASVRVHARRKLVELAVEHHRSEPARARARAPLHSVDLARLELLEFVRRKPRFHRERSQDFERRVEIARRHGDADAGRVAIGGDGERAAERFGTFDELATRETSGAAILQQIAGDGRDAGTLGVGRLSRAHDEPHVDDGEAAPRDDRELEAVVEARAGNGWERDARSDAGRGRLGERILGRGRTRRSRCRRRVRGWSSGRRGRRARTDEHESGKTTKLHGAPP